jgi:hypothetical protein
VSPVAARNSFGFKPPIVVAPSATVAFALSAKTASGATAKVQGLLYAGLVDLDDHGGGPLAPLNGGLLLVGLMLLPLGKGQRRRVALIAASAGLVLITALAGCSGGSSHSSSGTSTPVFGSGALSQPVTLSTVSVSSASGVATSVQQLPTIGFQ